MARDNPSAYLKRHLSMPRLMLHRYGDAIISVAHGPPLKPHWPGFPDSIPIPTFSEIRHRYFLGNFSRN